MREIPSAPERRGRDPFFSRDVRALASDPDAWAIRYPEGTMRPRRTASYGPAEEGARYVTEF